MMIITIWWSKATRLLEFSRSVSLDLRTRIFCDEEEDEEELRILVVGLFPCYLLTLAFMPDPRYQGQ